MIQGMRFVFAIMLCIANMIIYGLKVNISTAIMSMVQNPTATNDTNWDKSHAGSIISAYFAGYLVGMFPSGYFADRFNTKYVLLGCVFFNSIFTLLVPLVAHRYELLYALRFFTGLVSAANLPIVNVLVGKWVVFEEKALWVAIIYSGTSLGTVISILSTGWITALANWQTVFYIQGAVPFVWIILYAIMFADTPEEQKWISEEERDKLVKSPGHRGPQAVGTKRVVPWGQIFTSIPFLALMFTNTFGNFTWYLLLTCMPNYMGRILQFDIKKNATITCLPYLLNVIFNTFLGRILDFGRRREYWSQTAGRKIAVTISCIPAIIMVAIVGMFTPDRDTTVILLCASIVTSGAIFLGHLINQNDLAPNYAGILMGITNTPGTISAFLLPWLMDVFNKGGVHTVEGWRNLFGITVGAQITAFVIFMIFGSAEIQPWNDSVSATTA